MTTVLPLFRSCSGPSCPGRRHHFLTVTTIKTNAMIITVLKRSFPRSPQMFKCRGGPRPQFCMSPSTLLTADPLQAPSTSVPLNYVGAIGPPPKTDHERKLAEEACWTVEESDIATASADAVALARAAAEMAKNAAAIVGSSFSPRSEGSDGFPTEDGIALMKRGRLSEKVSSEKFKQFSAMGERPDAEQITESLYSDLHNFNSGDIENELLQAQYTNSIKVKSTRQKKRRALRSCATEKALANTLCMKSTPSVRKKRASLQEIDYSDPLRYLRGTTTTSKLLTAAEELELSEGIQDLIKLEKLQVELGERYSTQPTFAQWAAAARTDQKTLRKRLNHGKFCKDKLIKSNIRLVISIAKNFQGAGMNLQDLVQEGCRGLVRGAEKFDASKGFKFSTYAHWWIKQAVRRSLSDHSRTIRLPFHMVDATYRVREARKQLYSENGRYPDDEEIAEVTGLSMKRLQAVMMTPKAPRSLDQKIGISQNLKPSEVIADPDAETTVDLLMKQLMKQDLNKVLNSLNAREKQVVRWRFGLEDGRMKTLQEIGELMGVSRERIRQIESCAFRKLKNKNKTKSLKQYLIP